MQKPRIATFAAKPALTEKGEGGVPALNSEWVRLDGVFDGRLRTNLSYLSQHRSRITEQQEQAHDFFAFGNRDNGKGSWQFCVPYGSGEAFSQ